MPDRQLALVEVQVLPDEPKDLTAPQAEDQNQHVRRYSASAFAFAHSRKVRACSVVHAFRRLLRNAGSLTSAAGLRATSSRVIALFSADRRVARTSATDRAESVDSQHSPIAQHRR